MDENMSSDKDIFTKEIESWAGFGYALQKENRTLFQEMLALIFSCELLFFSSRCGRKTEAPCAARG
jgi:hypothetical protein